MPFARQNKYRAKTEGSALEMHVPLQYFKHQVTQWTGCQGTATSTTGIRPSQGPDQDLHSFTLQITAPVFQTLQMVLHFLTGQRKFSVFKRHLVGCKQMDQIVLFHF